jgi:arabinogalactan oligomer/maltooligosaccharide transport system permease protein
MTTYDETAKVPGLEIPVTLERPSKERPKFSDSWWRHLIGLAAVTFALFPVAYIVSAAFNADQSLSGSNLIPRHVTLDNFRSLFRTHAVQTKTASNAPEAHYLHWFANTMIVAITTAVLTVLLSALAAYAFSRFRFKGRRMGMLALLLIQMFPQLLAIVAIYLIVLRVGDVVGPLGLNTLTGLIVVYMGGALGVNTWLMKGFFDTIPTELDESARVDGATAAQIFWGVVLPLATPVLAVIGLFSFIGVINEFAIASALLQTNDHFTLPLGMRGYIDKQYSEHWGPFAAGVLIAAVPAALLFAFLQRFIVSGLTQGSVKG